MRRYEVRSVVPGNNSRLPNTSGLARISLHLLHGLDVPIRPCCQSSARRTWSWRTCVHRKEDLLAWLPWCCKTCWPCLLRHGRHQLPWPWHGWCCESCWPSLLLHGRHHLLRHINNLDYFGWTCITTLQKCRLCVV